MSEVSFPGDGQDGEQPPPAGPARDETADARGDHGAHGGGPGEAPGEGRQEDALAGPEDDWDPDAEMAAFFADLDAGRARIPEDWELECQGASISLGDAADVDLAELFSLLGPDGLGGEVFAQDRPADAMRPGPILAALTERAAGDPAGLTDNELLGAMSATGRLAARAEYLQLKTIAEFTRRRERQYEAARTAKVPPGCRDGEFPDAELGMELVTSPNAARDRMDLAGDLESRLPATRAALAAGMIDGYRARIIWQSTRFLTDADAAHADEVLAVLAPHLRYDQLGRKAAALAMKLDPEAAKRCKERARRDRQRVEACREDSGNASLSGRELAIEDVLASKAHIDALAAALRKGGVEGSLRQLRVLAFLDLTQGRDPLDRLTGPGPAGQDQARGGDDRSHEPGQHEGAADGCQDDPQAGHEHHGASESRDGDHQDHGGGRQDDADEAAPAQAEPGSGGRYLGGDPYQDDDDAGHDDPAGSGAASGEPVAPFPALINLTIPAGTLLGWSTAPGDAGGWGLLDPDDSRRLAKAASADPRTRWCITLTGPGGTAVAHGCARGPHRWAPGHPGGSRDGPDPPDTTTTSGQAAALAGLLRELNITFTPIAKGTCDHRHAEDRYTPSRKLGHLVRARTATCPAPGCGAHAYHNDLDHTIAYPAGITDECNLGPPCRRHHRVKQAPGWQLSQPEPGVMRWQTPSGRTYTTSPTVYET
jgi:hypothetical protein